MVNINLFSYIFFLFSGSGYTIQIVVSSCKISAPVFAYLSVIRLLIIYFTRFFLLIFSVQMTGSAVSFSIVVVSSWLRYIETGAEKKSVSNTKKPSIIITEWSINVRHNLHRLKKSPKRVEWKREIIFHHHQHVTYIMSVAIYEITNYFFLTI